LVAPRPTHFDDLPPGARVATGSLRRRAQLLHRRPDLRLDDIRGNVETRLRKLHDPGFAGLVLAQAGLERLGLTGGLTERLPPSWMWAAGAQGARALECRADDADVRGLLAALDDPATRAAVGAERALLASLGGGCQVPLGAVARVERDRLVLRGAVLSPDG